MSVPSISYADFDVPPDAMTRVVEDGLDRYNHEVSPLADVKPLGSFASGPGGQVIGGAVGRTWGTCCELMQLWVDPAHRQGDIGSRLLRRFEKRAAGRGCSVFYLSTFSFQAPDFYRRHGYVFHAEIRGFTDSIAKFLMYKESPARGER